MMISGKRIEIHCVRIFPLCDANASGARAVTVRAACKCVNSNRVCGLQMCGPCGPLVRVGTVTVRAACKCVNSNRVCGLQTCGPCGPLVRVGAVTVRAACKCVNSNRVCGLQMCGPCGPLVRVGAVTVRAASSGKASVKVKAPVIVAVTVTGTHRQHERARAAQRLVRCQHNADAAADGVGNERGPESGRRAAGGQEVGVAFCSKDVELRASTTRGPCRWPLLTPPPIALHPSSFIHNFS
eukprot:363518-Chlamydomonas_euryale.AAC.7